MAQPLEGIRVLDLGQIYQGPYAGFLLGKAGAEVIKVEPPTGERLRGLGGQSTPMSFALLNTNKKSITLDLKQDRGRELLLALVKQADVLLEMCRGTRRSWNAALRAVCSGWRGFSASLSGRRQPDSNGWPLFAAARSGRAFTSFSSNK